MRELVSKGEIMKKRRGKISGSEKNEDEFEIEKAEAQKKLLEEEHETVMARMGKQILPIPQVLRYQRNQPRQGNLLWEVPSR